MKKIIYVIIALVIIAGGYYFYDSSKKQANAPETELNNAQSQNDLGENPTPTPLVSATPESKPSTQTNVKDSGQPDYTPGTFSSGEEGGAGADVQVLEIGYDGSAFAPKSVDIKVNDWVFFKNNSSKDFWPASAPHPVHTDYPEFDAKKPIAPGKTFKFQFAKAGNWKFHDHLNPGATGVVNVK